MDAQTRMTLTVTMIKTFMAAILLLTGAQLRGYLLADEYGYKICHCRLDQSGPVQNMLIIFYQKLKNGE